ncbi:MAG: T9SS type A sorting domain-containing protein [Bacteroidetes bacterium]|nr:T9SS type A sorting domain-containing protein [Bacteroidota bacterium]
MNIKIFFLALFLSITSQSVFAQWTDLSLNSSDHLSRIHMINDSSGFVNSVHSLHRTDSRGETWDTIYYGADIFILDFYFLDTQTGYLLLNTNSANKLYQTIDGGTNWSETGNAPGGKLFFTSPDNGYIQSSSFQHYSTIDGGSTWSSAATSHPSAAEGDISFPNDSVGYMAGWYPGGMAKTTDAGQTWTSNYDVGVECYDILFLNSDTGYVVGWWEAISKTVDGGTSWTNINYEPLSAIKFKAIDCFDSNNCYVVGDSGNVLFNTDGENFLTDPIPGKENLNGVAVTEKFCYAVGENGTIFRKEHTINSSINHSDLIKTIKVFPNPAKDVLTLQADDDIRLLTISIFDMNGKIVQTYPAFQRQLDITNIPAGYYLLKLASNQGKYVLKLSIKNGE